MEFRRERPRQTPGRYEKLPQTGQSGNGRSGWLGTKLRTSTLMRSKLPLWDLIERRQTAFGSVIHDSGRLVFPVDMQKVGILPFKDPIRVCGEGSKQRNGYRSVAHCCKFPRWNVAPPAKPAESPRLSRVPAAGGARIKGRIPGGVPAPAKPQVPIPTPVSAARWRSEESVASRLRICARRQAVAQRSRRQPAQEKYTVPGDPGSPRRAARRIRY